MKKRFSAFLLAALMVAALMPSVSFAAATLVTDLAGLQAALANDEVTEIVLSNKITVTEGTVDLSANKAKTITTSYTDDAFLVTGGTLTLGANITVEAPAALTVSGGEVILAGAVLKGTYTGANVVAAKETGKLTINSGEIQSNPTSTTLVVKGQAECVMNGGRITSNGAHVAILAKENGKVTIAGGEVLATNCSTIAVEGSANVEVKGGTVETTCQDPEYIALYSFSGTKVTVDGGTVKAAAGYAISPESNQTEKVEITIKSGTIIGGKGAVRNNAGNDKFTITGGSFSHEIPEGITASGHTIIRPAYAGPVMNWVKVNAANNGVVKSGPLAASAGATITLYPKAAEGYVLDTVSVLDAEGNTVELDGLKFAIPAGGVTVSATFKLAE